MVSEVVNGHADVRGSVRTANGDATGRADRT
jgi:hypothetical protein